MSKTVWKYTLNEENEVSSGDSNGRKFQFKIPKGAEFLDVQMQGEDPRIWALVNPEAKKKTKEFVAYGTGHEIPGYMNLNYIGTVQMQSQIGDLVFHIFESTNRLES